MNTVDESLNHLIEAVRNSKEFQDYQIVKAKVEKYPEKKRSLDKYRTRMYKIQNNHGETDLYHHIDEIERESERFRQDALIDEFLTAELALCRMVQRINWTLIEELHFDMEIDMELVKEEKYQMIVDERLVTYINSLDTGNTPILDEIEREALASFVPIIRKEMQSFLKVLLSIKRPKRILEVGTAVGFSAILMAEYDPVECEIITIENYEKRIPIARENFIRAEKEEQITLLEGDAKDVLETLTEPFDLIFMDAAKGQYLNFLPRVLELLQPEGILISDNVLQDGDIIESRFAVTRRNRTIHKRMREYLYTLTHSEELTTAVLPVGDGITISTKKGRKA